jgi:hypothetical protein
VTQPGHVTHVLLQEGHLWGRKEVAIPITAVAGTSGRRRNAAEAGAEPASVRASRTFRSGWRLFKILVGPRWSACRRDSPSVAFETE